MGENWTLSLIPENIPDIRESEISAMATLNIIVAARREQIRLNYSNNLSETFLKRSPKCLGCFSPSLAPDTSLQQVGDGRIFPKARLAIALADVSGSFVTLELLDVVS